MKKFFVLSIMLCSCVFSQDIGVISPDTLIPQRQVVVPTQFSGCFYERTYSGDSVAKFNDKYIVKVWIKRAGSSIAFDSSFVIIQPKTRGIDTLNSRNGYIWRNKFELLPK